MQPGDTEQHKVPVEEDWNHWPLTHAYFHMALEFRSPPFLSRPPPIAPHGRQGNSTCGFRVGVDTLVLIFIGLEVIHIDLGSQGREKEESSHT